MLPPLDPETGRLPEGVHDADWSEVVERFGWNPRRRQLLDGLADAVEALAQAGCRRIWLDGSFVTAKEEPGDFDACWNPDGVDLDELDPVFLDSPVIGPPRRPASAVNFYPTSWSPPAGWPLSSSSRVSGMPPVRASSRSESEGSR